MILVCRKDIMCTNPLFHYNLILVNYEQKKDNTDHVHHSCFNILFQTCQVFYKFVFIKTVNRICKTVIKSY